MEKDYVEPKSSVEVSQNAKGQFTYKVKIYFVATDSVPEDIAKDVKAYYTLTKEQFEK